MSILLTSLSGLDTREATLLPANARVTTIVNGGLLNVTWGDLVQTIRDPLEQRISDLEAQSGGGGGGGAGPSIWPVSRTLTLTGAVNGSVSFNGSADFSLNTVMGEDAIAITSVIGLVSGLEGKFDKQGGTITGDTSVIGQLSANSFKVNGVATVSPKWALTSVDDATYTSGLIYGTDYVGLSILTKATGIRRDLRLTAGGQLSLDGNTFYHSGNFNPATKLDVDATAASAEKLATPRLINGVPFDGTADIDLGIVGDKTGVFPLPGPNTVWDVNHNLGKYPSYTVLDESGIEVSIAVTHVSLNAVRLESAIPMTGRVIFN